MKSVGSEDDPTAVELICVLLMTLFFCGVTAYVVVNNALEKAGEARESFVNTKVRTCFNPNPNPNPNATPEP